MEMIHEINEKYSNTISSTKMYEIRWLLQIRKDQDTKEMNKLLSVKIKIFKRQEWGITISLMIFFLFISENKQLSDEAQSPRIILLKKPASRWMKRG